MFFEPCCMVVRFCTSRYYSNERYRQRFKVLHSRLKDPKLAQITAVKDRASTHKRACGWGSHDGSWNIALAFMLENNRTGGLVRLSFLFEILQGHARTRSWVSRERKLHYYRQILQDIIQQKRTKISQETSPDQSGSESPNRRCKYEFIFSSWLERAISFLAV